MFDDVDLNKVTDMAITAKLEIMDKFVFHEIVFIYMKKNGIADLMVKKTKKLKW